MSDLSQALDDLRSIQIDMRKEPELCKLWGRTHYQRIRWCRQDKMRLLRSFGKCGVPTVASVMSISIQEARILMEQSAKSGLFK
jgi:hypothetical protein